MSQSPFRISQTSESGRKSRGLFLLLSKHQQYLDFYSHCIWVGSMVMLLRPAYTYNHNQTSLDSLMNKENVRTCELKFLLSTTWSFKLGLCQCSACGNYTMAFELSNFDPMAFELATIQRLFELWEWLSDCEAQATITGLLRVDPRIVWVCPGPGMIHHVQIHWQLAHLHWQHTCNMHMQQTGHS